MRRIGFFGHQRAERGVDLIPELVTALLARGFEVVVQDSSDRRCGKGAVSRLLSLWRSSFLPHILCKHRESKGDNARLTHLAYIEDFAAELSHCDLVIWPSRAEAYSQSLSGVVSECIATGVPIVVPAGCLPAQIAARYGCGVVFHDYSCVAIIAAVEEAARNFADLTARSRAAATAWHSQNGTDRLAAWIEHIVLER